MFDPVIGQFVNEDPSDFDPGDPNLRRFVGNDPTNATDPSGLEETVLSKAAGVFGWISDKADWIAQLLHNSQITPDDTEAIVRKAQYGFDPFEPQVTEYAKRFELAARRSVQTKPGDSLFTQMMVGGVRTVQHLSRTAESALEGDLAQAALKQPAFAAGAASNCSLLVIPATLEQESLAAMLRLAYPKESHLISRGMLREIAIKRDPNGFTANVDVLSHIANAMDQESGQSGSEAMPLIELVGLTFLTAEGALAMRGVRNCPAGALSNPTLYWHGAQEAVDRAAAEGLFAHGPGSGGKYWATTIGSQSAITDFLIGGTQNVDSLIPLRLSSKGAFEAVYTLVPEEASQFSRAWGFSYSWNPYQWYKGAIGQYYYQAVPVTWGQRATELGRATIITGAGVGGAAGADYLIDDR